VGVIACRDVVSLTGSWLKWLVIAIYNQEYLDYQLEQSSHAL
jgi:hypothetical protein